MDKVVLFPIKGSHADSHAQNGPTPVGPTPVGPTPVGPSALEDRDDDALMLMARAGEERAFEILVRRHQRRALGTAVRYLCDPLSAEDAAQNSFLDLLRYLDSYRPEGKFRAFFAKIVINNCRMANRRERNEASRRREFSSFEIESDNSLCDDGLPVQRERQRLIDEALTTLSQKLREVLILRYAAGLSLRDIGDALGIREGTVKSRLFAGVEKLCLALKAEEK